MQSKKDTHKEVFLNNILGVLVGLLAMKLMLPLIEGLSFETRSIVIVGVMFCLSYTRGYVIRRFFNKKNSTPI